MTSRVGRALFRDNEFQAMKAVTAALTVVPVIGGLAGVLGGPALVAGDRGPVHASTDSEFRFLSAAWFTLAPLIWTALPTAHTRPAVLRLVGAGIILGGLARIRSWRGLGRPRTMMVAAVALELGGVPALLAWHTRIVRQFKREASIVQG